jgi:hypothetical protein
MKMQRLLGSINVYLYPILFVSTQRRTDSLHHLRTLERLGRKIDGPPIAADPSGVKTCSTARVFELHPCSNPSSASALEGAEAVWCTSGADGS